MEACNARLDEMMAIVKAAMEAVGDGTLYGRCVLAEKGTAT